MVRTYKTTRLDAINEMLGAIGEAPVNSETNANISVSMASRLLDMEERRLQGYGWFWNTEKGYEIEPDANSKFPLQANWIRVDVQTGRYPNMILVKRGNFLYDAKNRRYELGVSKVVVDVVVFVPYEDMPEAARQFCMIRAGRVLQDRIVGSRNIHIWTKEDEYVAWNALQCDEADVADYTYYGDATTGRILSRGRTPLSDVVSDTGGFLPGGNPGLPVV